MKCATCAAALIVGLVGLPVAAQPADPDAPPDSPLWWTLSESISPAELRATLRDPEAHRRRYLAAVESGTVADPLKQDQLERVVYFNDSSRTPELMPMWMAASTLASLHHADPEAARQLLASCGLDPETVSLVGQILERHAVMEEEISQAIRGDAARFVEVQRDILGMTAGSYRHPEGRPELDQAIRSEDWSYLASRSQYDEETIAHLAKQWRRSPMAEAALVSLPEIRTALTDEDWNRFRDLLRERIARWSSGYQEIRSW